ncbi:TrmH family RNA methyltransferase [Microbacterium gorillae]|uniref:TrmH family RNA methyltransferase n=1 Tax=Microbacterium gorillae TaxID=1231063 RepID=UPI00058BBE57|nr:RNA methyltransferase [Microbacterium gorillae]
MPVLEITDAADARVSDFRSLTDAAWRRRHESVHGLYVAESFPVFERAVAAGHTLRAVLTQRRWAQRAAASAGEAPVLVADDDILESITGFDVHRGLLAAFDRPVPVPVAELLTGGTVLVLEDVTDTTNVGAAFRAAAALGASAVLVTPRCGDPLYRRSVRVSMGTVFQVPWTRTGEWPELSGQLHAAGYTVSALALAPDAVDLADYRPTAPVALVLGAEGPGLTPTAVDAADTVVTIPMDGGVDSLNVSSAAAVALWHLRSTSGL